MLSLYYKFVCRMVCISRYESPLGTVWMAGEGDALTGLWFEGQKHFPTALLERASERRLPLFEQAEAWLDAYFAGSEPGFSVSLRLCGTPFQQLVWQLLRDIPYGRLCTYGELAREVAARLGVPGMSARAVGNAVGRNPVSIIVPCHRVVGSTGSLTGYAGGVERKRYLLDLEKAARPSGGTLFR